MDPPMIRVENADTTASALTLHYINGKNKLDLKNISINIHSLLDHPERAYFGLDRQVVCGDAFLETFWSSAASLLDYFADFYTTDTPLMQSVWFHLLDLWQTASPVRLLDGCDDYDSDNEDNTSAPDQKLAEFKKNYNDTLDLIHRLSFSKPRTPLTDPCDPIIHSPSRKVDDCCGGWYEPGPFISGLKPWQQFLYSGAPGFNPATHDHNSSIDDAEVTSTRYILPQPAIALIQTHTARARTLAAKVAQTASSDLATSLSAFDANAISFPSSTARQYTRPSLTRPGTLLSYQLMQGAPPVRRHEGLTDPSMLVDEPGMVLLDEAVGTCMGREAYVPMTGPVGQEGVGFDVWAGSEKEDVLGWGRGGESRAGRGFADEVGRMFDEWYFEDV